MFRHHLRGAICAQWLVTEPLLCRNLRLSRLTLASGLEKSSKDGHSKKIEMSCPWEINHPHPFQK